MLSITAFQMLWSRRGLSKEVFQQRGLQNRGGRREERGRGLSVRLAGRWGQSCGVGNDLHFGEIWTPVQSWAPSCWRWWARSLRALRHLSCSHLAGQGAGCMAWACRPGLGLDFLSCVTSAFCWYLGMEDSVLGVPDM